MMISPDRVVVNLTEKVVVNLTEKARNLGLNPKP